MNGDQIVLAIPCEEGFEHVAHLVLGGVAARLNLTYESLDDLEVALESLLERAQEGGQVTVTLDVRGDAVHAAIGPFRPGTLRRELEAEEDGVGLRRVLGTVVDEFELDDREDGEWVRLKKSVQNGGAAS